MSHLIYMCVIHTPAVYPCNPYEHARSNSARVDLVVGYNIFINIFLKFFFIIYRGQKLGVALIH